MGQYPWGFTGVTPNASDNLPDRGRYDGSTSCSPTTARCPALRYITTPQWWARP